MAGAWSTLRVLLINNPAIDGVRKLAQSDDVVGLPLGDTTLKSESNCDACVLGKAHRLPFSKSSARARAPLDLIHTDVVTMPILGNKGERYILTVLDDYSRKAWIFCLQQKNEVGTALKQSRARVELETGRQIKKVCSDNGTEYVNDDLQAYYANAGIINQRSAPYTPAQNGRAERLNRTLVEGILSLLAHAGAPQHPSKEAATSFVHAYNRRTHSATGDRVPDALFYGRPADLSMLRTFGCRAWHAVSPSQRRKLDPKAVALVHVGYDGISKA